MKFDEYFSHQLVSGFHRFFFGGGVVPQRLQRGEFSRFTERGPRVTAALGRRMRQGAMFLAICCWEVQKGYQKKLLPGRFWALKHLINLQT